MIFCDNLSFTEHIDHITSAASKALSFVCRWGKYFKTVQTLQLLYSALVRPKLEYRSVVWSAYLRYQCDTIERVQHKFLRMVAYRIAPMSYTCHEYNPILIRMNMLMLRQRRIITDLVYNVLNGTIACSSLIETIKLCVFHEGY